MTDYGKDIDCTDSLNTGRYVSGVRLVGQALYRRYITPRGALRGGEDEENYGLDLTEMIGEVASAAKREAWKGRIRNEALKEARVSDAVATITDVSTGVGEAYEVEIDARSADGPFQLVLEVDEVTVKLLGFES